MFQTLQLTAPAPVKWDHAEYLERLIRTEELHGQVKRATSALARRDFDSIAFTGVSGSLIAIPTALAMNKTMLAVRKPEDAKCFTDGGSHSSRMVEGNIGSLRYIIMDDLVSSGDTMHRIINEVKIVAPQAECVGIYTVSAGRLDSVNDWL